MALKLKLLIFTILSNKIALCTALNHKAWSFYDDLESETSLEVEEAEEEEEAWYTNGFYILFIFIGVIVVIALLFICLCCLCNEKDSKDYEDDNYNNREKAIKTILKIESQISDGCKMGGVLEPNLAHLMSTTTNVNEIVSQLSQHLSAAHPGSLQNVKMREKSRPCGGSNIDISERRQSLPPRYNRTSQSNLSIGDIAKVHQALPEDDIRGCNVKAAATADGEASIIPPKASSTLPRQRLTDVNGLSLVNASRPSKSSHLYNKRALVSSSNSSGIHTQFTGESSLASSSSSDEHKPRAHNNAQKRYNANTVDRRLKSRSLHRLSYLSPSPEPIIHEVVRRQNTTAGDRTLKSRSLHRPGYHSPSREPIQEVVDKAAVEQAPSYGVNDFQQSKRSIAKSLSDLYETIQPDLEDTRQGNLDEHSRHSHLQNKIRLNKGDRNLKTRSLYRSSCHIPDILEVAGEADDELKCDIKTKVQVHASSSDLESDERERYSVHYERKSKKLSNA